MCALLILMLSITVHIFKMVSSNLVHIKCDFSLYNTGCEDSEGSTCDQNLNECICKSNYTIRLKNSVCLMPKKIDEDCISSAQCLVENSACFAKDQNLKQWKCQCNPEFWYNNTNGIDKCERKLSFGQFCQNNSHCGEGLHCSSNLTCVCDQHFYFNSSLNKCLHINATQCDEQQEWNPHLLQCVQKLYYSHRGSGGRASGGRGGGGRAGGGGRSSGSRSWFSGRAHPYRGKSSSHEMRYNFKVSLNLAVFNIALLILELHLI